MYIQCSSYAYGKNSFGESSEKSFRKALSRMSVTVKNEDTREKDMMSCTDFYNYHGGLITAVHAVTGSRPFSLAGDSQEWMKQINPYALQNILNKLLEAVQRGMWRTDAQTLDALRHAYLDAEGEVEAATDEQAE